MALYRELNGNIKCDLSHKILFTSENVLCNVYAYGSHNNRKNNRKCEMYGLA